MIEKFLTATAAIAMVATPVAASANPAASLSVAPRAASSMDEANDLAGAGIPALLILAGVAAIGIIAIIQESDDDDDSPDSN